MDTPRLTELVKGGGCARKLPAEDLVEVLGRLPAFKHPWSRPAGPMDDAAVFHPEGSRWAFVYTMDVVTPIVDDPLVYGRIAAANAISDVYAMGGQPQMALCYIGLPDALGLDVLEAMMRGASEMANEAGCLVTGGHTIKSAEPQCGLAVVGSVDPERIWTQDKAVAGQALVLTKPIGSGTLSQAVKAGAFPAEAMAPAVAAMTTLNRDACAAGLRHGATAATDVTGFGLLGHLYHLASASGLTARIDAEAVPLLPRALEAVRAGHLPGGSRRNAGYVRRHVAASEAVEPALLSLLADAQTSGGLLLALPAEGARRVVEELPGAAVIGALVAGDPGRLEIG